MTDFSSEDVLAELRKLVRSNYIAAFVSSLLLIVFIWFFPTRTHVPSSRDSSPASGDSWTAVRGLEDRTEYDKAFSMAQRILSRYPSDPLGYSHLGNISLAMGHVKEAESYYARAYALVPSEEYEKIVRALQKRIQTEAATPQARP